MEKHRKATIQVERTVLSGQTEHKVPGQMNSVLFSTVCTMDMWKKLHLAEQELEDKLANEPAAGKVVWTVGLWSCSNLNLKKLVWGNKEISCGLEWFDGSDRRWGLQNYCHAGSSVPMAHGTSALLQLYSTGDTCVLANPDCWHFHQGCCGILCWLISLIRTRAEHCHLNGAGTASSVL